jgi:hypothetical protein
VALITPIQYTGSRSGSTSNTLATAFASDVTAGNIILVVAGCWSTRDVATPPTDTLGATPYTDRAGGTVKLRWWTVPVPSTGPCTVTVALASGLTEWIAMGIAEIPAGTYSYAYSGFTSDTDASPSTGSLPVTVDGAALFAFLTCQGNNSGTLTEDGAWTSISKAATYNPLPYSFMFRNANIGTYTGDWTAVGGGITTYRSGIVIEGTPTPPVREKILVVGDDVTLGSSYTVVHSLKKVARTIDQEGAVVIDGRQIMYEQSSVPAALANAAVIYAEDNGSGKTRLMVRFGSGASQQIAIEP